MLEFRKRHHEDIWHCLPDCSEWPASNFQRAFQDRFPDEKMRCVECERLFAAGRAAAARSGRRGTRKTSA